MRETMSHEQYVQSIRQQIVETAQAMLDGELSYLLGARQLNALRHQASVNSDDADFMVFVGIDSETDALPLGPVRGLWDKHALIKLQPEIDSAEAWAKSHAKPVCVRLIDRFRLSK